MTEEIKILDLRKILSTFPELIKSQEEALFTLMQELEDSRLNNKMIENAIMGEICREMDGEKKKFTNEASRKSELDVRLKQSPDYVLNDKCISDNEKAIKLKEIEMGYLRRMNQNAGFLVMLDKEIIK